MRLIKSKKVKTRKPHKCFGCGRYFYKGSTLDAVTFTEDGRIETDYWCDVCREYWNKYMQPNDLIMFGELKNEDEEGWEQVRKIIEK